MESGTTEDVAFTLLNPGPVNVSPAVREALAACADQCHREPEYLLLQERVRSLLVEVLEAGGEYEAVLITGSGTAAMEAMLVSCVQRRVVIVSNGIYGHRFARIARAQSIPHDTVETSWFERPRLEEVEAALENPEVDALAVVHHETTTGLLNDLPALAQLARKRGIHLLVDSVSGLGGETLDFSLVRPAAVCCTANKCLQGLPGISFVLLRRDVPLTMRSLYLDLEGLRDLQRRGDTAFTPAIQIMAALHAALEELREETLPGRIARYRRASERIREAMESLALELLLPPPLRSRTITCAKLPEGLTYERLHGRMREEGFVIYGGQGDLRRIAFRVANMGAIPAQRLEAFPAALKRAIS